MQSICKIISLIVRMILNCWLMLSHLEMQVHNRPMVSSIDFAVVFFNNVCDSIFLCNFICLQVRYCFEYNFSSVGRATPERLNPTLADSFQIQIQTSIQVHAIKVLAAIKMHAIQTLKQLQIHAIQVQARPGQKESTPHWPTPLRYKY